MDFRTFLHTNLVILDGGMGTLLQQQGLPSGEHPELWNLTHPGEITQIHKAYYDAGSNVVCTNTFGANLLKFSPDTLEQIITQAVNNAKAAQQQSTSDKEKFIALDIGPLGKLLKPLGELDFEQAVGIFAKTVQLGVACGVDLVLIETMNDSYETKAALLAVKENCDLPVIVSNAYSANGKLMTGATPAAMVALAEGMGADAIGANCSLGPKQLAGVVKSLLDNASIPVVCKPNAGLPRLQGDKTVFDVAPQEFAEELSVLVAQGLRGVGGCCGTTPDYIKAVWEQLKEQSPVAIQPKNKTVVSSYTHTVELGNRPVLIGERINPTGKKRFKQALVEQDMDYILSEGVKQQEKGVHILDVNVGIPEIDEQALLPEAVCRLQAVTSLPLQIDTADPQAMEAALRRYNGKAMINSVNGKQSSMDAIFPLVKKYGGVVVALTLDENGIPATAQGRVAIAKRILSVAETYGIDKKDIVFDTLTLTVSADNQAAIATLKALRTVKETLGCHTSLGVSNVSFGLPQRGVINSTFFALALENGLSAAIMNPYSNEMMQTYYAFNAVKGLDENCAEYITAADSFAIATATTATPKITSVQGSSALQEAIIKGFQDTAVGLTKELLKTKSSLAVINEEIIPALNIVGSGYENNTIYLPQLLISAEVAKHAFEVIKAATPATETQDKKGVFLLATVEGDIHDIGKNIVKLLLENYGFGVVDLGKDVPAQVVAQKAVELHAHVVGLSALMTTTVPAMEQTIQLIKQQAPWCKTVVGGAVLTQEVAQKIGADYYAKDAMETVRLAQNLIG